MNPQQIPAISEITDHEKIRVVIFRDGGFIHAPLPSLVQHLLTRIETLETGYAALKARVTALETP